MEYIAWFNLVAFQQASFLSLPLSQSNIVRFRFDKFTFVVCLRIPLNMFRLPSLLFHNCFVPARHLNAPSLNLIPNLHQPLQRQRHHEPQAESPCMTSTNLYLRLARGAKFTTTAACLCVLVLGTQPYPLSRGLHCHHE